MDTTLDEILPAPPVYLTNAAQTNTNIVPNSDETELHRDSVSAPAYSVHCKSDALNVLAEVLADFAQHGSPDQSKYNVPIFARQLRSPRSYYKLTLADTRGTFSSYHVLSDKEKTFRMREPVRLTEAFFEAIARGHFELVSRALDSELVDANTPGVGTYLGATPLICAIQNRQNKLVPLLISKGARINDFGIYRDLTLTIFNGSRKETDHNGVVRTPLQLACTLGDLPLVKSIMEVYSGDDSLIAPDGQIALRLASRNGHRDIVSYLPARRGGGYRRWKSNHIKLVRKATRSLKSLGHATKECLYVIPKEVITFLFKCLREALVELWRKKHKIFQWILRLSKRLAMEVVNFPQNMRKLLSHVWKFMIVLLTERIPKASRLMYNFIGKASKTLWKSLVWIFNRIISLLHTVLIAIITAFQKLTWQDIRNGVVDLGRAIFTSFPKKLFETLCGTIRMLGKAGKILSKIVFGVLWCILRHVIYASAVFVATHLWRIISAAGGTASAGFREVHVWLNPKA